MRHSSRVSTELNRILLGIIFFFLSLQATNAAAEPPIVPANIRALVDYETQANPMDRTRSNELIELEYFEIPIHRPVSLANWTQADDRIRNALTSKTPKGLMRKWIINPEDTMYRQNMVKWLQSNGYDTTPKRGGLYAFRTASASYLVSAGDGFWFSAKVSTNKTGGNWQDKGLNDRQMRIARANSTLVDQVSAQDQKEKSHLLQRDVAAYNISEISLDLDQSMIVRDLGPIAVDPNLENIPLFAFADEKMGPELAKRAGLSSVLELYTTVLGPAVGKGMAEALARYNFILHAPHGQNIMIEYKVGGGPTGRVVFRDVQDMHYWKTYTDKMLGGKHRVGQVYEKRVDSVATIGSGFFHGLGELPGTLRDDPKFSGRQVIDDSMFKSFEQTLAMELGLPENSPEARLTNVEYSANPDYSLAYVSPEIFNRVSSGCKLKAQSRLQEAGF